MNQAELSLMKGMIDILNRHLKEPFLTSEQYSMRLADLKEFEEEAGFVYINSPTCKKRMNHVLDIVEMSNISKRIYKRCNNVEDIIEFANEKDMFVYLNLTGIDLVITYIDGVMAKLEVDNSIALIDFYNINIPYKINKKGTYVVKGVLQCGSHFYVDNVLYADCMSKKSKDNLEEAEKLGFDVVSHWLANNFDPKNLRSNLKYVYDYAKEEELKHDGVIFRFNDISYDRDEIVYEMLK